MQEWLNWPLSKSGKVKAFEGSNPSLSAKLITYPPLEGFHVPSLSWALKLPIIKPLMLKELTRSHKSGFTIVELLIVVVVIAILAAITIVAYNGIQTRARQSSVQTSVKQAYTKVVAYAVQNADVYPSDLSSAGVQDGTTTYQYRVDNTTSPRFFCITGTTQNTSYYLSTTVGSPTAGACPGHGANGATAITNMSLNPRVISGGASELSGRYSMVPSNVSGVSDGPLPSITSYARQTYLSAVSGGGRGFDIIANLDLANPPVSNALPVSSGSPLNVSAYIRSSVSNSAAYIECRVHDGAGNWLDTRGATPSVAYTANTWLRLSLNYTPPATGYLACTVRPNASVTWPAGSTIDLTGLMITRGSILNAYADGDSPGWAWNGTANSATSSGPPL